jgi:hypothetical protein
MLRPTVIELTRRLSTWINSLLASGEVVFATLRAIYAKPMRLIAVSLRDVLHPVWVTACAIQRQSTYA